MKLVKSAVIVAVFALAPFVALAEEAKAPASQPGGCCKKACPAEKPGCDVKAAADKSACCKKDGDKAACKSDGACKKEEKKAEAGSRCKAKDKQTAAAN